MINATRRILHIILGLILLLMGIAGLVLPIINGTVLLIIGFILLSFESPYVEKRLYMLTRKNKFIHELHQKLDTVLRKLFRK